MDALSEVLAAVRLSAGAFLDGELSAPWAIAASVGPEDCRPFGEVPAELIAYHYVVDGALRVELAGQPPLHAAAGDIVLLAHNDPHVLASGPGLAPVRPDDLIEPGSGALARLRLGGGGAPTRIVCGFLGTAVPGNPLVATLPAVLRVAVPAGPDGAWMQQAFRMAVRESGRRGPGAAAMLARLSELLFIAAIRRHMADLPEGGTGWLAGLSDPQVGRALALLHARVAEPWTAATLSSAVGLSRSAFAERFARLIGQPPMRYLANWRMQVAAGRLRDGGGPIARIGWEVGYASEAAFSRAFARAHGTTPAAWRRGGAAPDGAELGGSYIKNDSIVSDS